VSCPCERDRGSPPVPFGGEWTQPPAPRRHGSGCGCGYCSPRRLPSPPLPVTPLELLAVAACLRAVLILGCIGLWVLLMAVLYVR
jgi:hypothetical protein